MMPSFAFVERRLEELADVYERDMVGAPMTKTERRREKKFLRNHPVVQDWIQRYWSCVTA